MTGFCFPPVMFVLGFLLHLGFNTLLFFFLVFGHQAMADGQRCSLLIWYSQYPTLGGTLVVHPRVMVARRSLHSRGYSTYLTLLDRSAPTSFVHFSIPDNIP